MHLQSVTQRRPLAVAEAEVKQVQMIIFSYFIVIADLWKDQVFVCKDFHVFFVWLLKFVTTPGSTICFFRFARAIFSLINKLLWFVL